MGNTWHYVSRLFYYCVCSMVSAATIHAETTSPATEDGQKQEMIKGLALGFGLFFGAIIVLCVVCCLCCNNSCKCCCCKEKEKPKRFPHKARKRVGPSPTPSPPRSGTVTRSTIVSNGRS